MKKQQKRKGDDYYEAAMQRYRAAHVTQVVIRTVNDQHVCDACKAIAAKTWDIDDVPVLPYEHCTCKLGCRCFVRPVVD